MTEKELLMSVRGFIYTTYVWDEETTIGDDESIMDTGLVDSTGVLELVTWLESEHGVTVDDDELTPDNLDSMNKIVNFIIKKSAK